MSDSRGAGKQPVTYVGPWNPDDTYHPLKIVTHSGATHLSVGRNTGVEPGTDRTKWLPLGRVREALFSSATTPTVDDPSPPYGVDGSSTALRFRVFLSAAGTSSTTIKLYLNTVEIASVTIAGGALSGDTTLSEPLVDGDVLTVAATALGAGITKITAIAYLAA